MMLDFNKGYPTTTRPGSNTFPKFLDSSEEQGFEDGGAEDRIAVRGPMLAKPDPELPLKASIGRRPAPARMEGPSVTAVSGGNADIKMDASARHCGPTGQRAWVGPSDPLGSPRDPVTD